jgi:hypothetical protein
VAQVAHEPQVAHEAHQMHHKSRQRPPLLQPRQ